MLWRKIHTKSISVANYQCSCGMQASVLSHACTHAHKQTILRPCWILSGTTWVSQHQEGKTNVDLLEQEIVSGSGISWAICKSAPWPRHITMPANHHSAFYRPDALPTTQPTASKHWRQHICAVAKCINASAKIVALLANLLKHTYKAYDNKASYYHHNVRRTSQPSV